MDLALKDAEKCTDMRPDWGKGWGRVGAALFAKREYSEAAVAYSKGVKADPSNAALQEGLANAKAEDSRVPAMGGMGGLFGKDILGRLAQEPKFAAHLAVRGAGRGKGEWRRRVERQEVCRWCRP